MKLPGKKGNGAGRSGDLAEGAVVLRGVGLLLLLSAMVGGGGVIGQLLLLRELLVSFYGNELTMGVILANWLLLEAAGALAAGRRATDLPGSLRLYTSLLLLYAAFLPAALFYSRGAQYLFFRPLPGEAVGALSLTVASLLLLAPPAFVHGALFPLGCRLLSPVLGESGSIGKVYLYETVGTLAGGVAFTFFLAGRCHSLGLALNIAALHLLGCFFLLLFFPQKSRRRLSPVRGKTMPALALAAALLLFMFNAPAGNFLHLLSLERQWGSREVVHYENSPYGNIVAVHSKGEYTFFYDGRPVITVPAPDKALIGGYVHLAAVAHPRPRSVLLLAAGPGGFLNELLKHPVEEAVYVDLDPHLPAVMAGLALPFTEQEFNDPRVKIEYLDGRLFLARTEQRFDLILLGFVVPETLQANRLFTGEFFALAARRLLDDGILVFSAPGSPVLMSAEMLSLNASLYHTLREHFAHVYVSPGEINIFMASSAPLSICPAVLNGRLEARGLAGEFVAGSYLDYRLDVERERRLRESLAAKEARLNRDLSPAAFYYAIGLWGETFSPGALRALKELERFKVHHYLLAALGLTALVPVVGRFKRGAQKKRENQADPAGKQGGPWPAALTWAVLTSGAAGMALDLLVLFVFQCLYGFVYQMVGLLVASFMAGTFWGGRWGLGFAAAPNRRRNIFLLLDGTAAALLLAFYPFTRLLQFLVTYIPAGAVFAPIAAFAFCGGFVVGAQFPLAAALFYLGKGDSGVAAGTLYSADLLGGWAAGLAVSLVLFPLLGLWQTLLVLGLVKLGSFVILWIFAGKVTLFGKL